MPDKLKEFQPQTCEEKPCPFWAIRHEVERLQLTKQAGLQCRTLLSSLAQDVTSTEETHHDYSSFRLFLTSVRTVIWKQDYKEYTQLKEHHIEVNANSKLTVNKIKMVSINCISCSFVSPRSCPSLNRIIRGCVSITVWKLVILHFLFS